MKDLECPYCGTAQDVNHDDGQGYDENETHQQQCCECEKIFVFSVYVLYSYTPAKADCLNGEPHDFRPTHTFPKEFTKMRCENCAIERELTKEEKCQIINP